MEVTIRQESGKLEKFKKFEWNLVLNLDTIMRFTQNDLVRHIDVKVYMAFLVTIMLFWIITPNTGNYAK